eukprot:gene1460-4619_t
MHISRDPKQRDQATAFRMVIETLALMSGSVIMGVIITASADDSGSNTGCKNCSSPNPEPFVPNEGAKRGYMISGIFIAFVSVILGSILIVGVPESKETLVKVLKPESFFKTLKSLWQLRSYRVLVSMFLWAWMANNVNQTNFILWLKYGFGKDAEFQLFLITLLCTTTGTLPLWYTVMHRIGKPLSFAIGLVKTQSHGPSILAFLPPPWDWELFTSFPGQCFPMLSGIAISLSTLALNFADFQTQPCCGEPQPPAVRETLKYLMSVVPTTLLFLSLFFTQFYTLGPKRVRQVKQMLESRRQREAMDSDETFPLAFASDDIKSNGSCKQWKISFTRPT